MDDQFITTAEAATTILDTDFPVVKKKVVNDFFDAFEETMDQAPVIFKRPEEGEICEHCSA